MKTVFSLFVPALCVAGVLFFIAAGGFSFLVETAGRFTQTAATFFAPSITITDLRKTYNGTSDTFAAQHISPQTMPSGAATTTRLRILIVPGHEPTDGGTEFRGVRERTVVVDIADALAGILATNPRYEVIVSRNKTAWNPILQTYFDTHRNDIETFRDEHKARMQSLLAEGSVRSADDQVVHNNATPEAALHLWGTNKWASDTNVGIAIHIHLNDYGGRKWNTVGIHKGFTIYVPEHQYSNAEASIALGHSLAARLSQYHATSTLPQERKGVVEDQGLVAIGRYNTADYASVLIEYGYIYEPQFRDERITPLVVADYAYQTYLGLQDFLGDPVTPTYGSLAFPYEWSSVSETTGPSVYALQAALRYLGVYPPTGSSFSECPITGTFGSCTTASLSAYQKSHGISPLGLLGPKTIGFLMRDLVHASDAP